MSASELSSLTDKQLLKRYVDSRCEDAFAELVERHAPLVLSVCRRHLPTEQDAEDAFQATFLVLVRQAAAVRWSHSVGPWLYTVATKVTMNTRREIARRRETDLSSVAEPAEQSLAAIESRELCEQFDRALSGLSRRYRDPLILFYLQGKSRGEIAKLLNVKVGTVKIRLQRGRNKLRLLLAVRGVALAMAAVAIQETVAAEVSKSLASAACDVARATPNSSAITKLAEQEIHAMARSSLAAKGVVAVAASAVLAVATIPGIISGMATAQKQEVIELAAAEQDQTARDPFAARKASSTKSEAKAQDPFGQTNTRKKRPFVPVDSRSIPVSFSPSEVRILNSLEQNTDLNYLDQPFQDAIDDISFRHAIPIKIDTRALEDYGIGTDTPVTITLHGVTLNSALHLLLNDLDLIYVIQHEVMQITTPEVAKKSKQIHVYKLDGFVAQGESQEELVGLLEQISEEDATETALFGQRAVVKAPFKEHQRIMRLLRALAD